MTYTKSHPEIRLTSLITFNTLLLKNDSNRISSSRTKVVSYPLRTICRKKKSWFFYEIHEKIYFLNIFVISSSFAEVRFHRLITYLFPYFVVTKKTANFSKCHWSRTKLVINSNKQLKKCKLKLQKCLTVRSLTIRIFFK